MSHLLKLLNLFLLLPIVASATCNTRGSGSYTDKLRLYLPIQDECPGALIDTSTASYYRNFQIIEATNTYNFLNPTNTNYVQLNPSSIQTSSVFLTSGTINTFSYGNDRSTQTYFASRLPSTASFTSLNAGSYITTGTVVAGTVTALGFIQGTTLTATNIFISTNNGSASSVTYAIGNVPNTGLYAINGSTIGIALGGIASMAVSSLAITNMTPCVAGFRRVGSNKCVFDGSAAVDILASSTPIGIATAYATLDSSTLNGTKAKLAILHVNCRLIHSGGGVLQGTVLWLKPTGTSIADDVCEAINGTGATAAERAKDYAEVSMSLNQNQDFDYSCRIDNGVGTSHICEIKLWGYEE